MNKEESDNYEYGNMLREIFVDGKLIVDDTFSSIRERLSDKQQ